MVRCSRRRDCSSVSEWTCVTHNGLGPLGYGNAGCRALAWSPERSQLDASLIAAGSRWGALNPITRVRPDGVSGSPLSLYNLGNLTTWH
jgi:hypothetical protein